MGEELAEHEGVVGLGVVLWELDVLVHVKRDDMLEAKRFSIIRSDFHAQKTSIHTKAFAP